MWFISLLQLGCTLAQSCQTLLRTAELVAFKHVVYFLFTKATLPVQKWHLLLLCREELLHSADVFVFLSRLTWAAYVLEKKTKFLSSNLSVKKRQRKALAFVLCHCSVFTSCLHVTQSRRGMRVHFFCCSLGFFNLSSVFLAHTFFSPINRKTERNEWLSLVGSPKLTSTCSHAAWKSGTFDSIHAICGRKWCMYIHELYINCLAPSYFFEWYWSDIDRHYEVALSSAITAIHTKVPTTAVSRSVFKFALTCTLIFIFSVDMRAIFWVTRGFTHSIWLKILLISCTPDKWIQRCGCGVGKMLTKSWFAMF